MSPFHSWSRGGALGLCSIADLPCIFFGLLQEWRIPNIFHNNSGGSIEPHRLDFFPPISHTGGGGKTRKLPANVGISSKKSAGPGQPGSVIVTTSFRVCPVGKGIIKWGSATRLIHLLDTGSPEEDHEQACFNAELAPACPRLKVFIIFRDVFKVRELLYRPLCA